MLSFILEFFGNVERFYFGSLHYLASSEPSYVFSLLKIVLPIAVQFAECLFCLVFFLEKVIKNKFLSKLR